MGEMDSALRSPSPPWSRRSNARKYRIASIALVTSLLLGAILFLPLPTTYDRSRDLVIQKLTDVTTEHIGTLQSSQSKEGSSLSTVKSRYAYATFLGPNDADIFHDNYLIGTRILAYQLLHAPETRTLMGIPFIVLVASNVTHDKRERLRLDGAVVIQAPKVDGGWIQTDVPNWQDVLTKLRLWELTQFERVLFIDGDTVVTKSLDGVFDDPATATYDTKSNPKEIKDDEAPLPDKYAFAGFQEMLETHNYPPVENETHIDWHNFNYFNSGFFVLRPDLDMLRYYLRFTSLRDRFEPKMPEQNLLNYAHRHEGNMPWKRLHYKWNMHNPSMEDLEGGVHSLHEKWWSPVHEELKPILESWRWRMEGFYEARDQLAGR